MKPLDSAIVDEALSLLGEVMDVRNRSSSHFVVCGGSSLLTLSLVSRSTTKDVDILAKMEYGLVNTAKTIARLVA